MTISYFVNRFFTPISIMPVERHEGVKALYLFGTRVAIWSVNY